MLHNVILINCKNSTINGKNRMSSKQMCVTKMLTFHKELHPKENHAKYSLILTEYTIILLQIQKWLIYTCNIKYVLFECCLPRMSRTFGIFCTADSTCVGKINHIDWLFSLSESAHVERNGHRRNKRLE